VDINNTDTGRLLTKLVGPKPGIPKLVSEMTTTEVAEVLYLYCKDHSHGTNTEQKTVSALEEMGFRMSPTKKSDNLQGYQLELYGFISSIKNPI